MSGPGIVSSVSRNPASGFSSLPLIPFYLIMNLFSCITKYFTMSYICCFEYVWEFVCGRARAGPYSHKPKVKGLTSLAGN
jgi:hypothetical protein